MDFVGANQDYFDATPQMPRPQRSGLCATIGKELTRESEVVEKMVQKIEVVLNGLRGFRVPGNYVCGDSNSQIFPLGFPFYGDRDNFSSVDGRGSVDDEVHR